MDVHGTKLARTIRSELSKDAAFELRERGFVVIRGSFHPNGWNGWPSHTPAPSRRQQATTSTLSARPRA